MRLAKLAKRIISNHETNDRRKTWFNILQRHDAINQNRSTPTSVRYKQNVLVWFYVLVSANRTYTWQEDNFASACLQLVRIEFSECSWVLKCCGLCSPGPSLYYPLQLRTGALSFGYIEACRRFQASSWFAVLLEI